MSNTAENTANHTMTDTAKNIIQKRMPRPNGKQLQAFRDRHRYIAYGGARGGGKSWFVRWKAVLLALRYPGIRILITRKTYRELLNNHLLPLQQILSGICDYHRGDKCFPFPNGSAIWFGYCADESDLGQYQGAEYDIWFADEAGQFPESWLTAIDTCVRGVGDYPRRTYFTLNPGGPSHGYFKRLFIDRQFREGEYAEDYSFIQALCTDNHALMAAQPEYLRSLEKLPPKLRDAWLYGRWDIYQGQFFEELRLSPDPELCRKAGISTEEARRQGRFTHVIAPFDLNAGEKRGWNILRSYDFGYNKPFSMGYWAVDYDGVLYRIAEFYGCTGTPDEGVRWAPEEQFRRIREFEEQHPLLRGRKITDSVADPAIWDASRGESVAETAGRYGIWFTPGDNRRIAGWMQVHYRLGFDENGYPRMYVFDTCAAFIRTMPLLQYAKTVPEDLDTGAEDHCADEVRYLCMSRPVRPVAARPGDTGWDPLGAAMHPLSPLR